MSKFVRVENGIAAEIVIESACVYENKTGKDAIALWYNADFASRCVEAPDDVVQGMAYDPATGTFSTPVVTSTDTPEEPAESLLLQLAADQESRICALELGLK